MKIKPEDLKNYIGKKIRTILMENKDAKHFVGFDSDGNVVLQDYIGGYSVFSAANPWETYEEPKKKVKMWQWICLTQTNPSKYALTRMFYRDQDEVLRAEIMTPFKHADWTEIEVDE